jgi:hypothetical protein
LLTGLNVPKNLNTRQALHAAQKRLIHWLNNTMNTVTSLKVVKNKVAPWLNPPWPRAADCCGWRPAGCPALFSSPANASNCIPMIFTPFGLNRGGIDERWFASTTPAANENRTPDEGLSYVVAGRNRFTLQQAVAECGAAIIGERIWRKYKKWPVYSKFFDNMGPIPHHMHQNAKQAALLGLEGKPESYYFPPQHNNVGNNFPYTFMGLEPGTTKATCAAAWKIGTRATTASWI